MRTFLTLLFCTLLACPTLAGTEYRVNATDSDGNEVTYEVRFGGGKAFEMSTGFDPKSGEFVYLTWKRGEAAPEPAAEIWDHETGRTIKLYTFPGVEQPLPIIPSIKEMAVCPKTGDKNYQSERTIMYD